MSTHTISRRRNPNATLVAIGLAGFIYAASQAAVFPSLPTFQRSLHISVSAASWILVTYLLSASVATPIIGRLGDMYGKDRLLVWTMGGLTFGTVLAALAPSIALLDIARVIQGTGGGVVPLSFGIVRDEFPPRRVASSIGLVSSMLGIGGGAGIVLGAVILSNLSWHWLFWLTLIPTVIATILAYFFVPPSPVRNPQPINWISAILMSAGLTGVLIAISETADWGWGSARTLGLLLVGLAICGAWIWWEVRSRHPLVDMRLMRLRPVWATNLAAALLGGGMFSLFLIVPEFVEQPRSSGFGLGSSIIQAGLFLLPLAGSMLIMSMVAGRMAHRFGSKTSLLIGSPAATLSLVLLLVAHSHPWEFYLVSTVFGSGIGLAYAALGNLVIEAVPRTHTGVASGMNAVMRTLGGAVSSALVGTFIAADTHHGQPAEAGFLLAMGVSAGWLAAVLLAALLIPSRTVEDRESAFSDEVASTSHRHVGVQVEA